MDISKKNKIIYYAIFAVFILAVFGVGFWVGKNQVACRVCSPESLNFSLFWDAYNELRSNFINPEKIDDQKIIYGAISGMTKSLGDPYTDFFDPKQAKIFQQDLMGSFEGIGIEVGIKKDQLIIIAPLKGTPGEKIGLKSGDQIIKIDGKITSDMSIDEAVSIIRGKRGTKVVLTIFRDGWKDTKDIEITREKIKVDSINWKIIGDDIAYVDIQQFDQSLSSDFRKAAIEILNSPAKKIILDLRDNPGGYLEVSQEIAGWFLEDGKIVAIEDFGKNKSQKYFKASGNAALASYPVIVLINGGSASASEILAGALRDNKNIKLIGQKSFGKGSVQDFIKLGDNSSFLKITVAKWLTPNGNLISEIGLAPDIKVEITEDDFNNNKDPQLEKAIEIIKTLK